MKSSLTNGSSVRAQLHGPSAIGFGKGRADACAAAAWLDLGRGTEAVAAASRALDDFTALPASHQPASQVTGARIDLASAYLLSGNLDAAEDALGHVLSAPAHLGNASLAGRLTRARAELASPRWSGAPSARQLQEALGGWHTG